jgi:hypothetical protein
MSDNCCVEIICAPQHAKVFEEEVGLPQQHRDLSSVTVPKGLVFMMVEEADNGAYDELSSLKDIPFFGSHGCGDAYGPAIFASDGQTFIYMETLFGRSTPAVLVYANGEMDKLSLRDAKAYWKVLARARKMMDKLAVAPRKKKEK